MCLTAWIHKYRGNECVWRKLMYQRPADGTISIHGLPREVLENALLKLLGRRAYPTLLQMALQRGLPRWAAPWLVPDSRSSNCVRTPCPGA